MWHLHLEGSRLFILQIRVGEGVGVMAEPHGNSNILDLMDSSNPNFNCGFRSLWGFFVMQSLIPIYYVLHNYLVHGKINR